MKANGSILPVTLVVVLGVVLSFSAFARAQKPPSDSDELSLVKLQDLEVVTPTLRLQKVSDTPATTTVITARDIAEFGFRTLADALQTVTGMYVRNDRNYLTLGVRGFSIPGDLGNRVVLLIDGYRVNDPAYHQPLIDYMLPVPIEAVSRIEIVKGPGSVLYGSDALLATINVITKDGADLQGGAIKAERGNKSTSRDVLTYGRKLGADTDLIASGLFYSTHGDTVVQSPGIAAIRDADQEEAYLGFAKLRSGGWTLSVAGSRRFKEIPTASYETIEGKGSSTSDAYFFSDVNYYGAIDSTKNFSMRASFNNYNYNGHYILQDPTVGLLDLMDRLETYWSRAEFHFNWDVAPWNKLTAGGDYERDFRVKQKLYDSFFGTTLDINTPTWNYGIFLQDQIDLGPKTDLLLGGRFHEYRDSSNVFDYRTALVDRHLPDTTLKFLYGTASRTPTPYELFYTDGIPLIANPSLKIEKITTYEVVIIHNLPEGVSGMLSGFYYTIHDLIVQTDIGGGFVQPQNVGTSRAQGLELDLRKQWLSGALVRFGGVLQNAKDEDGRHRVDSPYSIVNAGLVVPIVRRSNTLAVDFQYLGDRKTRAGGHTGVSYLTSLHFRSRDVLGFRNFDLTASVNNLFNEDAFMTGGSEHRQDLIPSPRRVVLFGLQYRF